jgi:SAM-dependent methyltransferase
MMVLDMGQLPDVPSCRFPDAGGMTGTTESNESFQLTVEAAEAYEANFVPALFAEWAGHLVDAAGVGPGQRVLDVACGTGIVARTAAARLAGSGVVVGTDLNEAMLAVAARVAPAIEWRLADAAHQPFDDGAFDVVLCQAALMFVPDRVAALREMGRTAVDGGTVAVQVWDRLAGQPAYGPLVAAAARHAGPEAVDLLSSYWVAGDHDDLRGWFASAGLTVRRFDTRLGTAHFPSLEQVVRVEVESTPLRDRISDATYGAILADAVAALAPFETPEGRAEIPISGHLVVATP